MWQDLRYASRQLLGAPAFSLTAVLTLALAIGATVTMYSIVRNTLLEPLPYPESQRLVGVALTYPQEKPNNEGTGASADFAAAHSKSFQSIGILDDSVKGSNLSIGSGSSGRVLQIKAQRVSAGYFQTLGLQPELGRNFAAEEDLPSGPKVALLSDGLWARSFNRDPNVINRVIRLNGESFTVVGIMPVSLYGAGGRARGATVPIDIWQPIQLNQKDPGYNGNNYNMVARLRPGVSLVQAQQEMDSLNQPFYKEFPDYLTWTSKNKLLHGFHVWPLKDVMVSEVRTSVLALAAAVIAVLLVACLNLAGLMTARSSRRMKEIALRTALGASRGNVLRLLMCESLVLALVGAGLGLLLAHGMIPALLAVSPLQLPQLQGGTQVWTLACFSLLVACGTTVVFGLIPALGIFRQDAISALQGGHSIGATSSQMQIGKVLMVGQVAMATVLLTSASLLLGSFLKLRSLPSGVETERLAIAQVTLKGDSYADTLHTTQFIDKVTMKLRAYPGVKSIAAVIGLPLDRGLNTGGQPFGRPDMRESIEERTVTPNYFRTLGVPMMAGRDITTADDAKAVPVAIISETAAKRWWPDRSPIGEQVVVGGKNEAPRTIVGVVADTHSYSLADTPSVMVYEPFAQTSDVLTKILNGWFPTTFAVRLSGDVDIAAALQNAVNEADAEIPVAKFEMMQALVDRTLAGPQFFSWLAGGFAGFALLLAVIGLFGLLSYQVTQRTREIGVRLAIGADRTQILLLILRRGLALTGGGLLIGAVASLAVPRLVSSVLADNVYVGDGSITTVLSSSTASLAIAAAAMMVAAMFASYLPARRASGIEPMAALRTD